MGVRNQAIMWLQKNFGRPTGPIYTSKYYKPEESWPKKSVWWFQIPISSVEENSNTNINLVCQTAPDANTFHYLKVPSRFFIEHLSKFHIAEEKISIYLSTDPQKIFIEERGIGSLDFSRYLVNSK